jgi:hypothetical protein
MMKRVSDCNAGIYQKYGLDNYEERLTAPTINVFSDENAVQVKNIELAEQMEAELQKYLEGLDLEPQYDKEEAQEHEEAGFQH